MPHFKHFLLLDSQPADVLCDAPFELEPALGAADDAALALLDASGEANATLVGVCDSTRVWRTERRCEARRSALCLGPRAFVRREQCAARGVKRRSTALWLSLFLGGFGGDR